MKNDGRSAFASALSRFNSNMKEAEARIDRVLELFAISPVDLDPRGVVWKLEHVLDSFDDKIRAEVRILAPSADETQISNLSNLLEVSLGLNTLFRVVRHFYLLGKKTGSLLTMAQLQMALPGIMEEAEAYHASLKSLTEGKMIGDGLGPLVVSRFMEGKPSREIARDTMLVETEFEGRKLLIIKAKGPGGNVGKPGEAVRKLMNERNNISIVITVDAGLKLEGETSGAVVSGIGAAIGGPGVERYKIEEVATQHKVPLHAVVVKMSEKEALTEMAKPIIEASSKASEKVREIILSESKPGDTVILAGIGNSMGIGQ
jgi:hypothetical protein